MKENKIRIGIAIDESGTPNLSNTKQETNHFCLGATVYNYDKFQSIEKEIYKIRMDTIPRKQIIHFREIRNRKTKQKISRRIGEMHNDIYLFGIISNKETLREYKDKIDKDDKKYYNKCLMYLFERIGDMIEKIKKNYTNIEIEKIYIEESVCNENMARSFLNSCKQNPLRKETKTLKNFDFSKLEKVKKSENSILQISDFMASSLGACVNGGMIEGTGSPRYIYWMRKKIYGYRKEVGIIGNGIYPIHNIDEINIDGYTRIILKNLHLI